jgi:hypothetical protein
MKIATRWFVSLLSGSVVCMALVMLFVRAHVRLFVLLDELDRYSRFPVESFSHLLTRQRHIAVCNVGDVTKTKQAPWPKSASELYQPSDRVLSAKLVPTFADKEFHVFSVMYPCGRILGFIDQSRYFSSK